MSICITESLCCTVEINKTCKSATLQQNLKIKCTKNQTMSLPHLKKKKKKKRIIELAELQ